MLWINCHSYITVLQLFWSNVQTTIDNAFVFTYFDYVIFWELYFGKGDTTFGDLGHNIMPVSFSVPYLFRVHSMHSLLLVMLLMYLRLCVQVSMKVPSTCTFE